VRTNWRSVAQALRLSFAGAAQSELYELPLGQLKKYPLRCIFLLRGGADLVFFKSQLASLCP